jgi:hypothetical protein
MASKYGLRQKHSKVQEAFNRKKRAVVDDEDEERVCDDDDDDNFVVYDREYDRRYLKKVKRDLNDEDTDSDSEDDDYTPDEDEDEDEDEEDVDKDVVVDRKYTTRWYKPQTPFKQYINSPLSRPIRDQIKTVLNHIGHTREETKKFFTEKFERGLIMVFRPVVGLKQQCECFACGHQRYISHHAFFEDEKTTIFNLGCECAVKYEYLNKVYSFIHKHANRLKSELRLDEPLHTKLTTLISECVNYMQQQEELWKKTKK